MTDYYTADLHLGHTKVANLRGFTDVADHDRTILDNIRATLKAGDRLWILGDIAIGSSENTALLALAKLHYEQITMHLISGNHDSVHPMHRNSEEAQYKFMAHAFSSVDTMGTIRHNRAKIILSHFPYTGDHGPERYAEYRPRDTGLPVIHGHTHSTEKVSYSPGGSLQICVSLDAWDMKPVSKEVLTELIKYHLTRKAPQPPHQPTRGPLDALFMAWTIPGINPRYHHEQQLRLQHEWPILHSIITQIVQKEYNDRQQTQR